jgi:hypothetical protein
VSGLGAAPCPYRNARASRWGGGGRRLRQLSQFAPLPQQIQQPRLVAPDARGAPPGSRHRLPRLRSFLRQLVLTAQLKPQGQPVPPALGLHAHQTQRIHRLQSS